MVKQEKLIIRSILAHTLGYDMYQLQKTVQWHVHTICLCSRRELVTDVWTTLKPNTGKYHAWWLTFAICKWEAQHQLILMCVTKTALDSMNLFQNVQKYLFCWAKTQYIGVMWIISEWARSGVPNPRAAARYRSTAWLEPGRGKKVNKKSFYFIFVISRKIYYFEKGPDTPVCTSEPR